MPYVASTRPPISACVEEHERRELVGMFRCALAACRSVRKVVCCAVGLRWLCVCRECCCRPMFLFPGRPSTSSGSRGACGLNKTTNNTCLFASVSPHVGRARKRRTARYGGGWKDTTGLMMLAWDTPEDGEGRGRRKVAFVSVGQSYAVAYESSMFS